MPQNRKRIVLSQLRELAAMQCTEREMASFFNMSQSYFRRLKVQYPRVAKAIEDGREQGKVSIRRKQFMLASSNAAMAIHLGKQYLGQTDKVINELTGPDGRDLPAHQIVNLGNLSIEERRQLASTLDRVLESPDNQTTGKSKAAKRQRAE